MKNLINKKVPKFLKCLKGSVCSFPFTYQGRQWNICAPRLDSNMRPFCKTSEIREEYDFCLTSDEEYVALENHKIVVTNGNNSKFNFFP